jgi:ArsR family transcriptional regulator, arsenate/arsenite/antimonite-responsive transcriptional repressor
MSMSVSMSTSMPISNPKAPESTNETASKRTKRDLASLQDPSDHSVDEIVQLFKLLADDTRIRILYYLQQTDELNVRQLCKLLRQRQPSVSHHLALLRVAQLINMRRDGKHNFYRLVPTRLEQFMTTFSGGASGQQARVCFEGFELRYTPQT